MSEKKILSALMKLDVFNDDHWTVDGAPKIEVISNEVGRVVKRQEIINLAPDLSRETYEKFLTNHSEVSSGEDSSTEELLTHVMLSFKEFTNSVGSISTSELEEVELSLKQQNDKISSQIRELQEFQVQVVKAISMVRERLKEAFPNSTNSNAIREFIDSQNAARAAKADRRNQILKVIKPDELDFRSPLDLAMSRKTKRGTQRPVNLLMK